MKKKEVVLFLDFDGVFHYFWPEPEASDAENSFFYFVPAFETVIRQFTDQIDIKLVISSTWRMNKTFDQLKAPFSKDIQALIIGITPNHDDNSEGSRLRECQQWISLNNYHGDWFGIDDNSDIWNHHQNLIFCDNGLKTKELQQLNDVFVNLINK